MNAITVSELMEEFNRRRDKDAIYFNDKKKTYGELYDEARKISSKLLELGIKKGDHVAVWMPNNDYFHPVFFGITSIGAVMVPMNTRYKTHEVEYIVNNSDSKGLIMVGNFLNINYTSMIEELRDKLPELEFIISIDKLPDVNKTLIKYDDIMGTEEVDAEALNDAYANVSVDDTAIILYTSGTTGAPKGAELMHKNIYINAKTTGNVMEVTSDDIYYIPLPLFHSFGLVLGTLTPLIFGAKVVLQDVFSPEKGLELIERHRCTMNFGVPAMFISELGVMEKKQFDTSSLRSGMMGGAPCPIEIVKATIEKMGCNVCIGYGITETSPLITLTRLDDPPEIRAESVGMPLPGVQVKIVDDNHMEVPVGEIGEIAVKGNVMRGYYKMPEKTAEVLDSEGWYYSGDLGKMDENGYVYVTGRKKDMLIVGGFNVYPRELEEFFYTHPKVSTCAVIGVKDDRLGEVVALYVIPKEGASLEGSELIDYCKDKIANFKVPKYVEIVKELPMTQSGKIQKFKLRESANEKYYYGRK